MRQLLMLTSCCALVALGGRAAALEQPAHQSVTLAACRAEGLPEAFCQRAGEEASNVDVEDFYAVPTHAQADAGQTLCQAVDTVMAREWDLADRVRTALAAGQTDEAARALGHALHTIQDACTHRGVSNPEHAWFSLSDACEDTRLSPDLNPEALGCAGEETTAAMQLVTAALAASGISPQSLANATEVELIEPGRSEKCDFLEEAEDWDGRDLMWNHDLVRGPILDAFDAGLTGASLPAGPCSALADPAELEAADLAPDVDVSDGTPSCFKVHLYCLGKADDFSGVESDAGASGCSVVHRTADPAGLVLVAGAALALAARRRLRAG